MAMILGKLKFLVTAGMVAVAAPAPAQKHDLDDLFGALQEAEGEAVQAIESKIIEEWSRSGSPSMDLLLERGREAMAAQDWDDAIGHFNALVDHAPDFAEGYNARATAYFQAGLYGPSLADIRQTLILNPRHFGALSGLGIILEQLGEEEGALRAWQAVQDISPNRPDLDETLRRLQRATRGETL